MITNISKLGIFGVTYCKPSLNKDSQLSRFDYEFWNQSKENKQDKEILFVREAREFCWCTEMGLGGEESGLTTN